MASSTSSHLIVAAIDFGTSFSGWGFSFKHDFDKEPTKIETKDWHGGNTITKKGPTSVLIHPDGSTLHSFGYDAEDTYAELCQTSKHEHWYYFKYFKMSLFTEKGLNRDMMLDDVCGKKLHAMTVFGLSIQYLKDDLLSLTQTRVMGIEEKDIYWVLTVPAIWNDAAKQFMREAAESAGIPNDSLTIALEPECASIYCRHVTEITGSPMTFSAGSKYMVVDAGGGTIDITVHEVTSTGYLRELCKASGGAWGGTRVDAAFRTFLDNLFGSGVMKAFEVQEVEDYIGLVRDFERKKRKTDSASDTLVTINLPLSLLIVYEQIMEIPFDNNILPLEYVALDGDKLRIKGDIIQDMFSESIKGTLSEVSKLLQQRAASGCSTIVMVGGFSESDIYKNAVKKQFSRHNIVIPQDAGLAVLKGAVIYGHVPTAICERVVRYTYGTNTTHRYEITCSHPVGRRKKDRNGIMRCYDLLDVHVKSGTRVVVGKVHKELVSCPIYDYQERIDYTIYASADDTVRLVTDPGCMTIGQLKVYITNPGREQEFRVTMLFGGTEIEVVCVEKSSGKVTKATVNFLG